MSALREYRLCRARVQGVSKVLIPVLENQNNVYTNGATAEPDVRNISALNSNRKIMIGASHHFFLTFRKSQSSRRIANFPIDTP